MKKIMFNDKFGLTCAVLQGRKTQTRRIAYNGETVRNIHFGDKGGDKDRLLLENGYYVVAASTYKVGEVVAIAQSYRDCPINLRPLRLNEQAGWSNKMFVKPELMPIRIRINYIRAQRLQDITEDECLKEGIRKVGPLPITNELFYTNEPSGTKRYDSPIEAYAALIDSVSGKGTWERNPWVFVYDFNVENQRII